MTQRALTQTSGPRVPVFVVKIAENERWASPPYVYETEAAKAREAEAQIGHTARVEPIRVAQLAGQTVASDQFGGCTVKRTINALRVKGKYLYGQTKIAGRVVTVRLPRQAEGHAPRWQVVRSA